MCMRNGCALIALTGGYRSKEISPVAVGINHFFRPSAHGALYLTCGFGPPGQVGLAGNDPEHMAALEERQAEVCRRGAGAGGSAGAAAGAGGAGSEEL